MGPAHFGIGLAAKPSAPKVPFLVLLVASELPDLLSFGFTALGIGTVGRRIDHPLDRTKAKAHTGTQVM